MALRWRLTLWFALILLIILVLSGLVLNLLLRHYLFGSLDETLRLNSARVHGSVSNTQDSGSLDFNMIHSSLPPVNEFSSPSIYIQLIDADGNVVVKSDNLRSQELPVNPALIEKALRGNSDIETVAAGNDVSLRIMASPLYMPDTVLILEVAQSMKPLEDILDRVSVSFVIGGFVAMVLTMVLGAILVRRTLRPVETMTETARNIADRSQLERRVGYRGPADEIGKLANTFDDMIVRLEKAFEAQKRFIADASHELRSPLTVIQGNIDLLKRKMGEQDRVESLRAIEVETRRLSTIASELLELAEVETERTENSESVSLKQLAIDEIKRSQVMASNLKISTGRLEELYVRGRRDNLRRALSNLVQNAIKYTAPGGSVTVSVFRENGWACLEVTDTGIGIDSEDITHLFDRFYRVNKARSRAEGGAGLGLAIVKAIVEHHGGKVTVESEPGKGSTFLIWLTL